MTDFLLTHYLTLKAIHILAVISWMAGMLYLPRLYVYHVENGQDSAIAAVFQVMERRLLRYIINPAMITAWVFGALMIWANPDLLHQGWFHVKLTCLIGMQIVHAMLARYRRHLARGTCTRSSRYFRFLNEVPTLLMIVIVVMAVIKPL